MFWNTKQLERENKALQSTVNHLRIDVSYYRDKSDTHKAQMETYLADRDKLENKVTEQGITINYYQKHTDELKAELATLKDMSKEQLIERITDLILEENHDSEKENLLAQITRALTVNPNIPEGDVQPQWSNQQK